MATNPKPVARRRARWPWVLGSFAVIALLLLGAVTYLLSSSGLSFVVARIVAQSGGRLTVEGAEGSAASTMRFKRLAWRGDDASVEASDVVVDWNPGALWSYKVSIRGLGAQRVSIAIKPSTGATPPPQNLALPLDVVIEQLGVAQLTWQAGPRAGAITGLQFGYRGGGTEHRIDGLHLVSDFGTLDGSVSLGATAPLPVRAKVALVGDGPLQGATLDGNVNGELARLAVDASGRWREARLDARATVTTFATSPLEQANITLADFDATNFLASLPHTRAFVELALRPQGPGIVGTVSARNDDVGPIDRDRWPIATLTGRYDYRNDNLALSDLDVTLAGGGRATGSGTLSLAPNGPPSAWSLNLRDVDLASLQTRLIRTRVAGTVSAQVDKARQVIVADVRDAQVAMRVSATVEDKRVIVRSIQAQAGGGSIKGSGEIALEGTNPFKADVELAQFDPSRFGAFPQGTLAGHLVASGSLKPAWRIAGNLQLAQGSRLANIATSGRISAVATAGSVRDIDLDVNAGTAHVLARGDTGTAGDKLTFSVDAPRLADLAVLVPDEVPRPLAGGLRATGVLQVEPGGPGGTIDARATDLRAGPAYAVQTLQVRASIVPGGSAARPIALDARKLSLDVQAQRVRVLDGAFTNVHFTADGTLAQHATTLTASGESVDFTARLEGGLTDIAREQRAWNGKLTALDNRGAVPLHLVAPAQISVSATHQRIADAVVTLAGGRVTIAELSRDSARITTRGDFTGVPLASAAALARRPLPLASTLVLGGAWAVAATPRLNGTFNVRREAGDIFGSESTQPGVATLAFGIQTLELSGSLRDDTLDARARFQATRAGSGEGTLHIGSIAGAAQGAIAPAAPLNASLVAELNSLQVLQPWIGTNAVVNGRAHVALAARGTIGAPVVSGELAGDALRVDAVPYGLHVSDGRVRAHLSEGSMVIDELVFAGGDGHFSATGTLAAGVGGSASQRTHVAWKADNFRVTNLPQLRLVIGGEGTLAIEDRHLALGGTVRVEQGHIEYEPQRPGKLSPDVVVKGRPAPAESTSGLGDLPLALDMQVDLGRDVTFIGEGLETALRGRVRVTSAPDGTLRGRGTINAVNGTYFAFGQKLVVDRGRMIFDGPLDNPALDVIALRKNLAVEAGVAVTGTVRVPIVQITSNPPVPENEALAWLLTGQGLSSSGRNDYAAISAASAALLSRRGGKPITTQIAQSIGLDDISVQSSGRGTSTPTGTSGVANQVVVFGKRINERLTLGYEQGLALSSGALRLEYTLTRTLTVRLEAGPVSGLGLVYRRNFQ